MSEEGERGGHLDAWGRVSHLEQMAQSTMCNLPGEVQGTARRTVGWSPGTRGRQERMKSEGEITGDSSLASTHLPAAATALFVLISVGQVRSS